MSIVSRPYKPAMACERCCFGTGDHAFWCPQFNIRNFVAAFEGAGRTLCSVHPEPPLRFMGMTVTTDPTMEPGTIRLENAAGDCLGTIVNVGAQRGDAFIEYCSALIRLGPPSPPIEPPGLTRDQWKQVARGKLIEPTTGPWSGLFAQPKEKP